MSLTAAETAEYVAKYVCLLIWVEILISGRLELILFGIDRPNGDRRIDRYICYWNHTGGFLESRSLRRSEEAWR